MTTLRTTEAFGDLLHQLDCLLPVTESGERIPVREYADVVADLLAFLARQMTELHNERMAEKQSFLAWLEARLGCEIDGLAGKTSVRAYDELRNVDGLLDVIEKNHPARTKVDVAVPRAYRVVNRARDEIAEGYERSMEKLRPIGTQIALTDRLIDLVVYRFYGLKAEEIAVIEGDGR